MSVSKGKADIAQTGRRLLTQTGHSWIGALRVRRKAVLAAHRKAFAALGSSRPAAMRQNTRTYAFTSGRARLGLPPLTKRSITWGKSSRALRNAAFAFSISPIP